MEQRQVDWSEIATKTERDMGHSYPFADALEISEQTEI